jgi:hypothetical protein
MPRDVYWNDPDWEFKMHVCPICAMNVIGKAMWPCSECRLLTCESCGLIPRGCGNDDHKLVCGNCQRDVFKGKRKYCSDPDCDDCSNKSPRFKKALQRKSGQYDAFRQQFDAEAWKATHQPINYEGRYTGRYLADIVLSDDAFERGYIDWLIAEGSRRRPNPQYTEAQNKNFQIYVREALALKDLISRTAIIPREQRKLND